MRSQTVGPFLNHFTNKWVVDRTYAGSPMLRPCGTTPGHSLEWSRLLLQVMGTRRSQAGSAAPLLEGAFRSSGAGRVGQNQRWVLLYFGLERQCVSPRPVLVALLRGRGGQC